MKFKIRIINKSYEISENIKIIKNDFTNKGIVKLDNFLDDKYYRHMKGKVKNMPYNHGKIPDKFSYYEGKVNRRLKKDLSDIFKNYIKKITGESYKISIKKFSHKDYTILHDEKKINKSGKAEFLFYLCGKWKFEWGGNRIITGNRNYIITPKKNSLTIYKKGRNINSFTQYVNHNAGKNEFIIIEGEITE